MSRREAAVENVTVIDNALQKASFAIDKVKQVSHKIKFFFTKRIHKILSLLLGQYNARQFIRKGESFK